MQLPRNMQLSRNHEGTLFSVLLSRLGWWGGARDRNFRVDSVNFRTSKYDIDS